jgi:O-succinylbenzoate synthase
MSARFVARNLIFSFPAGTSRGIMKERPTWYLILEENGQTGIGECAPLFGLSIEKEEGYEDKLRWTCENISMGFSALYDELENYPSLRMGLETAFISLRKESPYELFANPFSQGKGGIPINGLIWMNTADHMQKQVEQKIKEGFKCIKIKIGAIEWEKELTLIDKLRDRFEPWEMEIRVDANGAFDRKNVFDVLEDLTELEIHSIEQPTFDRDLLQEICAESAVPIALDESLIGLHSIEEKQALINDIMPDYLILKPSLLGGFRACEDWISLAEKNGIGWWVTSALESNVGLNAIAQWIGNYPLRVHQGLGTGGLFTNNIHSPLQVKDAKLWYGKNDAWEIID